MCGIVGGTAARNIENQLVAGLKRLEYRGYDSAGIAVIDQQQRIDRLRAKGKVQELERMLRQATLHGHCGIAHTRWATHGAPSALNAHPLISHDAFALVHNGIIENHASLRSQLQAQGYQFTSETDSETIVHLLHLHYQTEPDFLAAVNATVAQLTGAYALGIICAHEPGRLIAVRHGSPLVIGCGAGENFIASDPLALSGVTTNFMYLEDHDIADVTPQAVTIYARGKAVQRALKVLENSGEVVERGDYRHYMMKEIAEQPAAIASCLEGRLDHHAVLAHAFGFAAPEIFARVKRVQLVACGTSFHAAAVARYWLEALAGIPCTVEVASEFRYRQPVVQEATLFVCLSQSGETADTLAALRLAKQLDYLSTLALCNVPESSLVREAELNFMTRAGVEIGVASTKAFTTQLTALLLLTLQLGQHYKLTASRTAEIIGALQQLPQLVQQVLQLDPLVAQLATRFADKHHALFLGRGVLYPVALEGALKLKEISYIHAEGYPAGELKHGPLALVDKNMPVIAIAPTDALLEKIKSNLQEVRARGGELYLFTDNGMALVETSTTFHIIAMPPVDAVLAPIVYTVPLQLLAYHVAVLKGTDVDQPRNLAKSVTVE